MTSTGVVWLFGGDVVYRSADQGSDWVDVSPSGVTGQPLVAFALDSNNAWLAVPSGEPMGSITFYGTADAGASWQRLGRAPITGSFVHQMTFIDPTHGWLLVSLGAATGSEAVSIWETTDGGRSWAERAESPAPQQSSPPGRLSSACDKSGITFSTDLTGWLAISCATGAPFIDRTVDGGHTWETQILPAAAGQTSQTLSYGTSVKPPVFLNQSVGLLPVDLALGKNNLPSLVVYMTRDGGHTWSAGVPVTSGQAMAAASADYWVVAVPPHEIAATHDGQHYNLISADTDLSQTQQLSFADPEHGVALVARTNGGYELLRTTDGGVHWTWIGPGAETAIKGVFDSGLVAAGSFPASPGRVTCIIHGGGPAPGIQVPGLCTTATSQDSATGDWKVTFTESWDAAQFHGGSDRATGRLSHSWTYLVDGGGQVVLSGQSGNFPPEEVS
jgi:photosystem II stability/assembly factor-like uncharacterized protein